MKMKVMYINVDNESENNSNVDNESENNVY